MPAPPAAFLRHPADDLFSVAAHVAPAIDRALHERLPEGPRVPGPPFDAFRRKSGQTPRLTLQSARPLGERRVAGELQNSSRERPQDLALNARVLLEHLLKSLGVSTKKRSGVFAVTVAVRGVGSSSEISPTKSPAPRVATRLPFLATSTWPSTTRRTPALGRLPCRAPSRPVLLLVSRSASWTAPYAKDRRREARVSATRLLVLAEQPHVRANPNRARSPSRFPERRLSSAARHRQSLKSNEILGGRCRRRTWRSFGACRTPITAATWKRCSTNSTPDRVHPWLQLQFGGEAPCTGGTKASARESENLKKPSLRSRQSKQRSGTLASESSPSVTSGDAAARAAQ